MTVYVESHPHWRDACARGIVLRELTLTEESGTPFARAVFDRAGLVRIMPLPQSRVSYLPVGKGRRLYATLEEACAGRGWKLVTR